MKDAECIAGPVHFPLVGRDVDVGEIVSVPDDTVLPADYFRLVESTPPAAKTVTKVKE